MHPVSLDSRGEVGLHFDEVSSRSKFRPAAVCGQRCLWFCVVFEMVVLVAVVAAVTLKGDSDDRPVYAALKPMSRVS